VPLGEKPKVRGSNLAKGTRQNSQVPSVELVPAIVYASMQLQDAITRGIRLFNKNLTFRKPVKVCTEGDVCPVPVIQTSFQSSFLEKNLSKNKKLGKWRLRSGKRRE